MSVGSPVYTPCPISKCLTTTVTVLALPTGRNALGANVPAAACASASSLPVANQMPSVSPAPAAVDVLRNVRRDIVPPSLWLQERIGFIVNSPDERGSSQAARRFLDRGADAHVRCAAADVAGHRGVDVGVGRLLLGHQQRGGGHHLPGLAIAALRDVELFPRRLHGVALLRLEALDRRDLHAGLQRGQRSNARSHRLAVDVNRARAAQRHAAAVLGAGEVQVVAQHPQEGCVGRDVRRDVDAFLVDEIGRHGGLRMGRRKDAAVRFLSHAAQASILAMSRGAIEGTGAPWAGSNRESCTTEPRAVAYNSLFRQRNSSWKPSSSIPSPIRSPIFPRARANCGGIFDFDVKAERLGAVAKELENPKIWDDPQRAQELGREKKQLEGVVDVLTRLQSDLADSAELFGLARTEGDDATVHSVQADVATIAKA